MEIQNSVNQSTRNAMNDQIQSTPNNEHLTAMVRAFWMSFGVTLCLGALIGYLLFLWNLILDQLLDGVSREIVWIRFVHGMQFDVVWMRNVVWIRFIYLITTNQGPS